MRLHLRLFGKLGLKSLSVMKQFFGAFLVIERFSEAHLMPLSCTSCALLAPVSPCCNRVPNFCQNEKYRFHRVPTVSQPCQNETYRFHFSSRECTSRAPLVHLLYPFRAILVPLSCNSRDPSAPVSTVCVQNVSSMCQNKKYGVPFMHITAPLVHFLCTSHTPSAPESLCRAKERKLEYLTSLLVPPIVPSLPPYRIPSPWHSFIPPPPEKRGGGGGGVVVYFGSRDIGGGVGLDKRIQGGLKEKGGAK